ncbi:MAG: hypothetical protein U1F43_04510 [Myxococcota bacterium]
MLVRRLSFIALTSVLALVACDDAANTATDTAAADSTADVADVSGDAGSDAAADSATPADTSTPADSSVATDSAAPDDTTAPVDTSVPDDTTPPEDTVAPPDDTVVPPDDTVVPPDDTVVPPEDTVVPPDDTAVDLVTFDEVHPIYAAKCSPCHTHAAPTAGSGGHNIGGTPIATAYADSQKAAAFYTKCVNQGLTKGACTIVRIKDGSMPRLAGCTGNPATDHANPACLTQAQQDLIQQWIDDGMPAPQ